MYPILTKRDFRDIDPNIIWRSYLDPNLNFKKNLKKTIFLRKFGKFEIFLIILLGLR